MLSRYEVLMLTRDAPDLSFDIPPLAPEYIEDTTPEEVQALLIVAKAIAERFNTAWQTSKTSYNHYHAPTEDLDTDTGQSVAWEAWYWRSKAIEKIAREWAEYVEDLQRLAQEFEKEGRNI